MKKLIIIASFSLILLSCPEDGSDFDSGKKSFYAIDHSGSTSKYYQVEARLLAQNNLCEIWVETGCGVTASTAQNIANRYKDVIYDKMTAAFGWDDQGRNVMQWADYYGDRNGKLTIFLLDIKDNYIKDINNSYIAGYFSYYDLLRVSGSNVCDMIYMDTNPAKVGSNDFYETLVHEMQHLMNDVTSRHFRNGNKMDTWIDEGLSEAATWIYSEKHNSGRLNWYIYNEEYNGLIKNGNNFFVWNNRTNNNPSAVLDDYATVYLFFQWLRIQYGNAEIYRNILKSEYTGYKAVVDAIGYSDWDSLLKTWLAANFIRSSTGEFGYKGDKTLNNITRHYAPVNIGDTITLYPGEGVYSSNISSEPVTGEENIKYAYISTTTVLSSFTPGSTLLTYNNNTDNKNGKGESGTITGIAPPASVNISSRSLQPSFSGPHKIGAGDISGLGRNE